MKGEVKKAAKRGDQDVAKTLAREIVRSRKACNRLHVSKTQLNSVMMQMEQQHCSHSRGKRSSTAILHTPSPTRPRCAVGRNGIHFERHPRARNHTITTCRSMKGLLYKLAMYCDIEGQQTTRVRDCLRRKRDRSSLPTTTWMGCPAPPLPPSPRLEGA